MFGARSRGLLLFAAVSISMLTAASGATFGLVELHREAVDEQLYPWSSIGKLYNETGGSCSGVVIARDKILTAAHCLFNARTRRFIPARALHFLVGYRTITTEAINGRSRRSCPTRAARRTSSPAASTAGSTTTTVAAS